jgi:UDP-glucose 4-epimerase
MWRGLTTAYTPGRMRALVTGGAGFIGSHLVDALLARGDAVSVVDDLSSGRREQVPDGVPLHVVDIAEIADAMAEERPDVVFHLAAQVDVRKSVADPARDARVNVAGTASVLEAARAAGAQRVLLASTGGALYGKTAALPTPEDSPLAPFSPYGASKAAAETYLALYTRLHGLSTLALRFGNVYGPRQDPHGEAGVIAIFAGAVAGQRPVTVYGDGSQTRDYVYVGDVVSGFLAAADATATGAVNIGTGVETSVLELVDTLGVEARFAPARKGEVARSCLDVSRAAELLGWRAEVTLADGLERTLAAARATVA